MMLPLVELCQRLIDIAIKEFEGRLIKGKRLPPSAPRAALAL
jgi:hypothetical protein